MGREVRVPGPVTVAGQGEWGLQVVPDPCGSWYTPPRLPPALHIFSPSKIASLEGEVGGVLSSPFAPSHSVFTALWLSLATWFPCQALLLCFHPHHFALPGPRTPPPEGASPSSAHHDCHLPPPSCGCHIVPCTLWARSKLSAHKLSTKCV